MKNILIIILVLSISWQSYAQQEPLYNQYLFNQSLINPAYSGINDVFNVTTIARRQWTGVEGAPKTNTINISSSVFNNKVGVGLLVSQDKYGVNENTEIQAMYAYRIDLYNGKSISFGLQTGYFNYRYNYNLLTLESPDQALITSDANINQFNFGTGIFYKSKQLYLGVSIPRLMDVYQQSSSGETSISNRQIYISGGFVIDQLIALKLKPSALIKIVKGQPISIDLNISLLLLESLWVGASLRNFNTAGVNAQFEIIDMVRMGYGFEIPFNDLKNNSFGTHELMLSLDLELFQFHANGRRYF